MHVYMELGLGCRCPEMYSSPAGTFSRWEETLQGPGRGMYHLQQGRGSTKKGLAKPRVGQKRNMKILSLGNLGGGQQEVKVPFLWGGTSIGKGVGWGLPLGEGSPGTCLLCVCICLCVHVRVCACVCVKVHED